ncbi:general transcriptional corepressor trfA-like [Ruditapes philippinarum]|uniref:general transcriptional corepressor trfA-like n=1 Tax=Ruditapes philippinarum TaxID=129788 RepID=UPI00295B6579|nr:general transcriptional corepressor trfA-like [Ruditapes philippinarum]
MDKKELREYLGQNQHYHPEANPHPTNQHWWNNLHLKQTAPESSSTSVKPAQCTSGIPPPPQQQPQQQQQQQTGQTTEPQNMKRIDSKSVYMGLDFSD